MKFLNKFFIIARGNYRSQYFKVNVIIQNDKRNGGQLLKAFFSSFRIWKWIDKSCFYQQLWLFENSVQIFNFAQKMLTSVKICELIITFFGKLLWCNTTLQIFLLLTYFYLELWTTGFPLGSTRKSLGLIGSNSLLVTGIYNSNKFRGGHHLHIIFYFFSNVKGLSIC